MSRMLFTPAQTTATDVVDELGEVGGHVVRRLGAAVHAAEPAGHEHADAGEGGEPHRRGDGRRAVQPARHDVGQVAERDLDDRLVGGEQLEVVGGQADGRSAVEHRDRRRHRATVADDALDGAGHLDVLRVGHAVADDRALQRDDRLPGREGVADLVGDGQHQAALLSDGWSIGGRPGRAGRCAGSRRSAAAARWPRRAAATRVGPAPARPRPRRPASRRRRRSRRRPVAATAGRWVGSVAAAAHPRAVGALPQPHVLRRPGRGRSRDRRAPVGGWSAGQGGELVGVGRDEEQVVHQVGEPCGLGAPRPARRRAGRRRRLPRRRPGPPGRGRGCRRARPAPRR